MKPVYGQTIIKIETNTGFTRKGSPIPINRRVILKPGHPDYDVEFVKWENFEKKKLTAVAPVKGYK